MSHEELHNKKPKFLAIGITPLGFIAIGVIPMGVISIGAVPMGILSLGIVSMGVISVGTVAMGTVAAGIQTMGIVSIGPMGMGNLRIPAGQSQPHMDHSQPTPPGTMPGGEMAPSPAPADQSMPQAPYNKPDDGTHQH